MYLKGLPHCSCSQSLKRSFSTWALTRNPVFSLIPAFAGMTPFVAINVAVYKIKKPFKIGLFIFFGGGIRIRTGE